MTNTSSGESHFRPVGVAIAVLATAAILVATALATISAVAAPVNPMPFRGYVYDESFEGVAGADVTITTKNGETVVASHDIVSGSSGYYSITFDTYEYDYGWTVEVYATDGVSENTNTSVIVEGAFNWINVTLSTEIPEFGGTLGLSTVFAVAGIMAMVVVFGRRRR